MKRIFIFLFCLPFMVQAQFSGTTFSEAKASGKAKWVFTMSEAPGFSTIGPDGKMAGVCHDLMMKFSEYVKTNHNITVSIEYQLTDSKDFPIFLEKVKNGKGGVFGLSNTTITQERKSAYNFSPPYITNIAMLLTHNSMVTLNDISEIKTKFNGMKAVTVKNSTNEKNILELKNKYYPDMQITYVNSFLDAIEIVASDPRTFTNVDFAYYFEAAKNRLPVKNHPAGNNATEQFGIIMPKSNDWSSEMDTFMKGFVESTEYKEILVKNLGASAMRFFNTLN